jgi:hypothetical protein
METKEYRMLVYSLATLAVLVGIIVFLYFGRDEMPDKIQNVDQTRQDAFSDDEQVKEYLYSCYVMTPSPERTRCYEEYYFTKHPEYAQQKARCLDSQDPQVCIDRLYRDMAFSVEPAFCRSMTGDDFKQECEEMR